MTKIFIFGRKIVFLSCLVNLCLCDRIVQKKPQGKRNYSDILVTKHNYYTNYLRRTTAKPNTVQSNQSFSWELVAINNNDVTDPAENAQVHPGNFTDDFYSFNCTMLAKPTTKLVPLRQRNPIASSTKRTPTSPLTTTKKPRILTTSSKRKKVIYVNPPIISEVETILDSAYDMVENVLTTKERIRVTTESSGAKKRTKKSPDGSKLITTQVHVTNEYEPITQSTITTSSDRIRGSKEVSSEEYYEEDLLYYDDEDDEESDEEDSVENPPVRAKPQKITAKPIQNAKPITAAQESITKRKKRRPEESSDSSDYDNDEYYDDEEDDFSLEDTFKYGSPSKDGVLDYFGDIMSRFGRFITSLMGFGGGKKKKVSNVNVQTLVPITKLKTRRPKRPAQNYYEFHDLYGYSDEMKTRNSLETNEEINKIDSEKGMWPGFGNWFGGDVSSSTAFPELSTKDNSWFFNIFSSSTTPTITTTEKPETTTLNPLDPGNFIALLAQHLVSTEAPAEHHVEGNQNPMKKVDYSSFQLWRLRPSNSWQVRFLTNLRTSSECEKCQWWKGPSLRGPTDLVIPRESLTFMEEKLQNQGIMFEVVISDLQKAITYSNPRMTRREQYEIEVEQGHPVTFYRYHRFDDIVKFLEFLQRKYPENVELSHFGRSSEGLPLIMAKIFSQGNGTMELRTEQSARRRLAERKYEKPVVLIEAGSHGREWIAPAVALWILNTLAQGIGQNDSHSEIYRSVDWLVVPVLNPDGYEFSHTHDRLWRKTRSTPRLEKSGFFSSLSFWNWFQGEDSGEENLNCTGVDLNRNWNYEWSKKGITGKVCGDLYSGPRAFSEPESNALHQFAMKHRKRIKVFISLHAYGQMISVPKEVRGRSEDLIDMAHVAAQALNGHSSLNRYLVDDANEMLFPRPGASDSFMLNMVGVPYSYTLELRDTGTHGFLLPPSYIEATARDAFDIIKAIIDNL